MRRTCRRLKNVIIIVEWTPSASKVPATTLKSSLNSFATSISSATAGGGGGNSNIQVGASYKYICVCLSCFCLTIVHAVFKCCMLYAIIYVIIYAFLCCIGESDSA